MIAFLFAAALAVPASAADFAVSAPAGWSVDSSTGGTSFTRPAAKNAGAATIFVSFRIPAEGEPTDPEALAKKRLAPDPLLGIPMGWTRSKNIRVAGRDAVVLDRRFRTPDRHAAKRPWLAEREVVVPGAGGYYVLSLIGPEASREADRKALRRALDGFTPAR